MDYREFLYALEKALLTAHKLRAVRLNSLDNGNKNPFIYIGSFLANGGKTYAFMVNGAGEGTYRCQAGPNYANESFMCTIDRKSKACDILRLVDPDDVEDTDPMELEEQINHSTGHNHDENGYDEFCSICNS